MALLLIVLVSLLYIALNYEKDDKITKYLHETTKSYSAFYQSTYTQHKEQAMLIYKLLIQQDDIISIYKALENANEAQKDRLRDKLYTLINENYKKLEVFNVRQLHFHLSNNDSFLRMHRPEKYGDNLTSVRQTIAYVNKNHKEIDGFEEGRVYNGFRFVFPIRDKNAKHLGSVENSYSANNFTKHLMDRYNVSSDFLVSKEVVDSKVFKSEKSNYINSPYEGFYCDKQVHAERQKYSLASQNEKKISENVVNKALEHIRMGKSISIYDKSTTQVITYLPITNPITKKVVASLVIKTQHKYIQNKLYNFYTAFGVISLLIFLMMFTVYREVKNSLARSNTLIAKNEEMKEEVIKAKKTLSKSLQVFSTNVIASDSDTKGIITYASDALCEISGYTKDELIGQPHSILRHPDTNNKLFQEMWDALKEEKSWKGNMKNAKKDGSFYWVSNKIVPRHDENHKLIGYSSIRHDITSAKAKEEFMANMSHELRTPLNAIIGFSSILEKKQLDLGDKKLSSTINKSALSLLKLINDILDLAKIEDSNFKIELYQFNAYNEFTEFSEQFEGLTHKKFLHYDVKVDNDLKGTFYGDWNRISQVILNIVSNAIKFTPQGGLIKVSGDYKDGFFILSIADNGIGMNQEVQDKIFQAFAQADGTTTRKYGGTGLGLSITQNLVGLMNGSIQVQSEEGKGTTFTVTIPLIKLQDKEDIQIDIVEEEDKENTLDGHVLIVEDNKTNQMLVKMLVEDFGLTCDIANDGVDAVAMYDPQKHLLVLMDENMPNLNGLGAMKAIKEKYKEETTPIIALTANTMAGDKERFLSEGMDGYISKPIDEDTLYKVLKKFL